MKRVLEVVERRWLLGGRYCRWHSGYVEGGDKAVYRLGSEDMFYKKPKISPLMPVPQIVSAASLRKAIILRNFQCPSAHVSVDVALGAPGAVKAGAVGLVLRVELHQVVDGEATVLDTKKKWGDGRELQLQVEVKIVSADDIKGDSSNEIAG
ncbi:unnamed protein product [Vitrella brassicaformis CCMP3155]|uniref:Uncharacterized protein n=1 Tax=Vitrella brassicaformis (strain CCMP3155) TaxID=1169540 RepID=A0A0G4EN85_VITBC|nr:unnamed protein product [Vitrella brassicaformis CCMP3155]|eukprot:CEL98489.1 unnamed protein product [Vitrella brassicaformis CCMP3155]